jgi:hypothetical protein
LVYIVTKQMTENVDSLPSFHTMGVINKHDISISGSL